MFEHVGTSRNRFKLRMLQPSSAEFRTEGSLPQCLNIVHVEAPSADAQRPGLLSGHLPGAVLSLDGQDQSRPEISTIPHGNPKMAIMQYLCNIFNIIQYYSILFNIIQGLQFFLDFFPVFFWIFFLFFCGDWLNLLFATF